MTRIRESVVAALLAAGAALMLLPLVVTLTNSVMTEEEIGINYDAIGSTAEAGAYANLKLVPDMVSLAQYAVVLLDKSQFLTMFWNSVALVVPIVAGQTLVGAMAAFAFAKLRFPGRERLFLVYLITMLMPFQVTLVPNYLAMERLGLLDTRWAIIWPGVFAAFGVFLLRQFMLHIPKAYVEAAQIDGASYAYIFARIIVPMTAPGIAALSILAFVDYWNMVEQPLIFIRDAYKLPLSIYLANVNEGDRGVAFAASVLYMAPMIFVFRYGENELIEGIQLSGVKG
ncbi:carbohydrate ABC transporter permease [Paenibacillus sp.]|uniref:carbohydrate ABC transporter permease n=1 Tax=Paenibacillus sp. TaxID=58172 RepID=UPI002D5A16F2|nr:carbohydrate ABC transporter permease [Paenibacillus sp.]HZG87746.1 carbohydrate ABC transporter permease [Paenibacillus sp.]